MRTKLMVLAVLAVLLGGCGVTPNAALRTAADSYATTMEALTEYREVGVLGAEDIIRIEKVRVVARAALDSWREALNDGQFPGAAIEKFRKELFRLIIELEAAQRRSGEMP